jgi:hypothetical protein
VTGDKSIALRAIEVGSKILLRPENVELNVVQRFFVP